MSLKNDKFPIKRHWLSSAFNVLVEMPDVFSSSRLSDARKRFLAGDNQLTAIRNWLACAGVIDASGRKGVALTDLGSIMSAQDPHAKSPVTWWLFHLHLCANSDSLPYSTFFTTFDVDGSWVSIDNIVDRLTKTVGEDGDARSRNTIESYFSGIENGLRPGQMLYGLGLVDRRSIVDIDGSTKRALRRTAIIAPDIMVVYATLLFQKSFYSKQTTVATPDLLKAGLSRALGMKDKDFREALSRIHHDKDFATFLQYRKQVNLDSIQFLKQGDAALKSVRTAAYRSGQVTWS